MQGVANRALSEADNTARAVATTLCTGPVNRLVLVIGAWSGVLGALLTVVMNGLHPHPADFRLKALLQEIAQSAA